MTKFICILELDVPVGVQVDDLIINPPDKWDWDYIINMDAPELKREPEEICCEVIRTNCQELGEN